MDHKSYLGFRTGYKSISIVYTIIGIAKNRQANLDIATLENKF